MMEWYQVISAFFTNGLRIVIGMYLVISVLKLSVDRRKTGIFSLCMAALITVMSCFLVRQLYIAGTEILFITLPVWYLFRSKTRMSVFLLFFYEIAVALWEFIISAGMGVLFRTERFLDASLPEHMMAVWIVRLLMLGIVLLAVRTREKENSSSRRIVSAVAVAGLFGTVFLSGQSAIDLSDGQMTVWIIFSMLILTAVLFFYLNNQYEMERRIAQLETEKNALLTRDYQMLKNTYAANAKLFHDFHNHTEALYRYLTKEKMAEAVRYLEDLRSPLGIVAQSVWTGDEAVDYLINSKIALGVSGRIQMNCKVEYPQHTNIRSVDLVAILGNLLDNALEAVNDIENGTEESLRFINLTIRRINEMIIIKVENGCKTAPKVEEGELQTTKADTALHGWGLKSVRAAADRYDGTIETEYDRNRFCTVVTLSYEPVRILKEIT